MKASEFVKANGLNKCRKILDDLTEQGHSGKFYQDLKRLVESYELVQSHGGLRSAIYLRNHNLVLPKYMKELKKAIADVESCK